MRLFFTVENVASREHGAVRAAADMRDLPGSLQEPEAATMPTQLLHGALYGRAGRLRASTSQMSRVPCRTPYTLSGNYPAFVREQITPQLSA